MTEDRERLAPMAAGSQAALDASLAASLVAVDPHGLGGACLRSQATPARAQWLDLLRELLPPALPLRRMPSSIGDNRLFGGLDLTATLKASRPIAERGVLATCDQGVVIVTMAERLSAHTSGCINQVLDTGEVSLQREGVDIRDHARCGIVALDESLADDEGVPASLLDRLALLVDLNAVHPRVALEQSHDPGQVMEARRLLSGVEIDTQVIGAICGTGLALGAGSLRVSTLAIRSAKILAALAGRRVVNAEDASSAARLVFAPRATQLPVADDAPASPSEPPESGKAPDTPAGSRSGDSTQSTFQPPTNATEAATQGAKIDDLVLTAARAAIPAGLLASLRVDSAARGRTASVGRTGANRQGGSRGRPLGVRSGVPRGHARLNVMETLRAAAPWQRLRGRLSTDGSLSSDEARIRIEPCDLRVTRYRQRTQTLTIFAVDASGSSALNRLAEAKGAIELLLADCYVRRDQVAVIVFRGRTSELLLPPTRSLVRAKRNLAGVPGGGGTPLAAALDKALEVGMQARRRGDTPVLVILSDGRANVTRDGVGGRDSAHGQALQAAARVRFAKLSTLFVDTSPRSNAQAREIAGALDARYIPLPYADARALSGIVAAASPRSR